MSKKRFAIAAAAGVSVLGLTAAGASTLGVHGGQGIAQQSNVISSSCTGGQYGDKIELWLPIDDNKVKRARLFQQYIQGCAGQQAQVALYKGDRQVAKSVPLTIEATGLDQWLSFGDGVGVQEFDSYRVTIGQIVN